MLSSRRSSTTRPSLGRTRATSCAHRELSLVSSFLWVLKVCLYRIGCFGRADPNQSIRLDLDNELEGASPHHSFPLFTTYPRLTCHSLTSLRRPLVHPRRTSHGPRRPEWDGHPYRGAEVFQRPSQLFLLSPKFSFLHSLSARLIFFSLFLLFFFQQPDIPKDEDRTRVPEVKKTYRLPPTTAIAGVLCRGWAEGTVVALGGKPKPKPKDMANL